MPANKSRTDYLDELNKAASRKAWMDTRCRIDHNMSLTGEHAYRVEKDRIRLDDSLAMPILVRK
jgi:cell division protein FtsB